jgi:RNA polymerase sigma-70 factor, ECF subfamily
MGQPPDDVTQLLVSWSNGDESALGHLLPVVYQELRKVASGYMRRERLDHTLQPTALINEAYLRLVDQSLPEWKGRTHFFGVAAQLMRQILVEHARSRGAAKRGGKQERVDLEESVVLNPDRPSRLIALDDALTALEAIDRRKSRVIELRFFGGLTVEEIAGSLGISVATVGRELRLAQAWLHREMDGGS